MNGLARNKHHAFAKDNQRRIITLGSLQIHDHDQSHFQMYVFIAP